MTAQPRVLSGLIVICVALFWAALILAAPRRLPSYAISSASVPDGAGDGWVLISGHAFRCDPSRKPGFIAHCETQIAGQPLTVAVSEGSANRLSKPCSARYAGKPIECTASVYAWNLASPLPHIEVPVNLYLTEAQVQELRWQNWQVNAPEWVWVAFAALTALLLPLAGALWLWPVRQKAWAVVLSASSFFVLAWVSLLGLISLWYVD